MTTITIRPVKAFTLKFYGPSGRLYETIEGSAIEMTESDAAHYLSIKDNSGNALWANEAPKPKARRAKVDETVDETVDVEIKNEPAE